MVCVAMTCRRQKYCFQIFGFTDSPPTFPQIEFHLKESLTQTAAQTGDEWSTSVHFSEYLTPHCGKAFRLTALRRRRVSKQLLSFIKLSFFPDQLFWQETSIYLIDVGRPSSVDTFHKHFLVKHEYDV